MRDERAIIRQAEPPDAEGIARVHLASAEDSLAPLAREWPAPDLERRTAQWARTLQVEDRVDLIATLADFVVGFIGGGPPRQERGIPGGVEIYVVHVLPANRGSGIGGQLWELGCTALRGAEQAPLCLETLAELPCCAFYEARGGEVLTRNPGTFFGGAVTHLTYVWRAGTPHQRRR